MPKEIHLIAAARPNFMKVAPLYRALKKESWCVCKLIHTGQHYDESMSGSFFSELGLPEPDYKLGVGSGTHAEQTGRTMIEYEKVLFSSRPDLVVVVGDVNATAACALVGAKCHVPVAHLEAGLRSGDRSMPEEINRIVTDSIVDLLWTPSLDANENLTREGIAPEKIVHVGNIMIDSLMFQWDEIQRSPILSELGLKAREFIPVTLHRPSNVDLPDRLEAIVKALVTVSRDIPVVFPVHPRTRKSLEGFGLLAALEAAPGVKLLEPLPYNTFMKLVTSARLIITDSGGVQEETTFLGIPCLTLRENTERPVTVTDGSNRLSNSHTLLSDLRSILGSPPTPKKPPALWDGKTASRVVASIQAFLEAREAPKRKPQAVAGRIG